MVPCNRGDIEVENQRERYEDQRAEDYGVLSRLAAGIWVKGIRRIQRHLGETFQHPSVGTLCETLTNGVTDFRGRRCLTRLEVSRLGSFPSH